MTRLWGPTLPSVHPSLPHSLPSHCTLFFPPFFFASVSSPQCFLFLSFSRFLPFPVLLYFYLILFLLPLVFHLPSSLVSHPLCFPSFLALLNSSSPFFDGVHSSVPSFPLLVALLFFFHSVLLQIFKHPTVALFLFHISPNVSNLFVFQLSAY